MPRLHTQQHQEKGEKEEMKYRQWVPPLVWFCAAAEAAIA